MSDVVSQKMFSQIADFILYQTPVFYLNQSVWRDEAFSYFLSKPEITQVVANTASDFNPPLYYLLLHFFIQIVGKSDEGLRILSFLLYILTVYVAYIFGKKILGEKFALFSSSLILLNPMLIYYAFEIRMYSLFALLSLLSAYALYRKNWKLYLLSSAFGLYTHSFYPLVFASQIFYLVFIEKISQKKLLRYILPFFLYIPWLPVILSQFTRSKNSWIYKVDLQLVKSVMGNLFTNFEGTPPEWWQYTAWLSVVILIFLSHLLFKKKRLFLLLSTPIFLPLALVLGYSLFKRPIYVNRYMIFIAVYETMAIAASIWLIKNKFLKSISMLLIISIVIGFNIFSPPYNQKTDFKTTFLQINNLAKESDFVYAETPIGFLESVYYYKHPENVFIYNPEKIAIPYYIGINSVSRDPSRRTFPPPPSKIFLVSDNAEYEAIINE